MVSLVIKATCIKKKGPSFVRSKPANWPAVVIVFKWERQMSNGFVGSWSLRLSFHKRALRSEVHLGVDWPGTRLLKQSSFAIFPSLETSLFKTWFLSDCLDVTQPALILTNNNSKTLCKGGQDDKPRNAEGNNSFRLEFRCVGKVIRIGNTRTWRIKFAQCVASSPVI